MSKNVQDCSPIKLLDREIWGWECHNVWWWINVIVTCFQPHEHSSRTTLPPSLSQVTQLPVSTNFDRISSHRTMQHQDNIKTRITSFSLHHHNHNHLVSSSLILQDSTPPMQQQAAMDYQSIHGPGRSNFSSSSPHRMPTVSAAQALQDLESSPTRCIPTGLANLDLALQITDPLQVSTSADQNYGGIPRGKVTEIYGPPGVGKTTLGMHLAARVLYQKEQVVWVDASHPISGPRFSQILQKLPSSEPLNNDTLLSNFNHFTTPTLSHLLALLTHTTQNFPPENTSLIIIDSFSTLIDSAFPRNADSTSTPKKPGVPNPSSRKFPLLQYLINALQKLATTRNIAIIILTQCVTKMRPGLGAALIPSISATAWEQGLGCRVALFRDWGWDDDEGNKVDGVRFAQVIKVDGTTLSDGRGMFAAFVIGKVGISSITPSQGSPLLSRPAPAVALPTQRRKRAEFEIPDSEDDEDYGWAEEDEELPPMPPQWQGSEDVLAPPQGDSEDELAL